MTFTFNIKQQKNMNQKTN